MQGNLSIMDLHLEANRSTSRPQELKNLPYIIKRLFSSDPYPSALGDAADALILKLVNLKMSRTRLNHLMTALATTGCINRLLTACRENGSVYQALQAPTTLAQSLANLLGRVDDRYTSQIRILTEAAATEAPIIADQQAASAARAAEFAATQAAIAKLAAYNAKKKPLDAITDKPAGPSALIFAELPINTRYSGASPSTDY